jgi:hypothetical protein
MEKVSRPEHEVHEDKAAHQDEQGDSQTVLKELLEQLDAQIACFDGLPRHEKYSFTTNVDLQYFMMLISNILKRMIKHSSATDSKDLI